MSAQIQRTARTERRLTGTEQYFVETVTLQPIAIEDPRLALVEPSEAAEILGVARPTVTGMMDRGTLTVIRRSGSNRRFVLRGEVDGMAAARGNARRS